MDPPLRLGTVEPPASKDAPNQLWSRGTGGGVALLPVSVFLLSAVGIYAMMSFRVTRRRRETGTRSAPGAHQRQALRSVLARPAGQAGLGLLADLAGALLLERLSGGALMGGRGAVILPVLAAATAVVGILATPGSVRRGLPIEAPVKAFSAATRTPQSASMRRQPRQRNVCVRHERDFDSEALRGRRRCCTVVL